MSINEDASKFEQSVVEDKKQNEHVCSPVVPVSKTLNERYESNANGNNTFTKSAEYLKVPAKHRSRTGSVVSFKEQSDIYEIDLESEKKRQIPRPPAVFSLRYYVMFIALFSPFIVTYSKTIINFAMTDMIHPDYKSKDTNHRHLSATTSSPEQASFLVTTQPTITNASTDLFSSKSSNSYFEHDNSCPVDIEQRERLEKELKKDRLRASNTKGEKFEWDTVKQGFLKAAYSIGHALFQVIGSRLSEIHGSHLIMSISSALIAVSCFAAPFLANLHFYLMFMDLLILGILGSFMTPALITLFSNWLTPSEKSMTLSLYLVSSRLGYALSSMLCGLLIKSELSWRYLFYSAGWTSLIFATIFWIFARARPHEHPFIKEEELHYLASKNTLVREAVKSRDAEAMKLATSIEMNKKVGNTIIENQDNHSSEGHDRKKVSTGAPWAAILTNKPVWAFVITKFCVKLAGDTVQTELPIYLNRVMHLSPLSNGSINAWNYVIFCISCLLVGTLAKHANKKHPFGWSKTTVRKFFQGIASFGVGSVLVILSMTICQNVPTMFALMVFFFLTTFATGGEAQIPLDISERYAGTIHAIGGSLAISGAIEPILVGFMLKGHAADQDRWRYVWLGVSAFAFFGGFVFLIFGDAKIQPFDKINLKDEEEETRNMDNGIDRKEVYVDKTLERDLAPTTDATSADKPDKKEPADGAPFRESTQI